jgi:hypothetical protein
VDDSLQRGPRLAKVVTTGERSSRLAVRVGELERDLQQEAVEVFDGQVGGAGPSEVVVDQVLPEPVRERSGDRDHCSSVLNAHPNQ